MLKPSLLLTGLLFLMIACGSQQTTSSVGGLIEITNVSSPVIGQCALNFQVVNLSNSEAHLIKLDFQFNDAQGDQLTRELVDVDLASVLSSVFLPANGIIQGTLQLDLIANALEAPSEGVIVLVGVTPQGIVQYFGEANCDEY
ncbi:MAG: hypothetical protein KDD48_03925 [Bdellovibrionales bacterium]|nr:hypothetical protein [Bdellovibrionales bacterium]